MTSWQSTDMASTWLQAARERNRMLAAATERMFALAGVREGARVLDVGTGTGDTAVMLAHQVGPAGEVVATDVAPGMVNAAASAARDAGFAHVKTAVVDLAAPLPDLGTFDAVVSRKVLMFVDDLPGALARVRKVLRPGGRFAAAVWDRLEDNPFNAIPIAAVRKRRGLPAPPPEVVKAFSLSDAAELRRTFESAGFASVAVERVPSVRDYASLDDAMRIMKTPLYSELLSLLPEDERREAAAEIEQAYRAFVRDDGTVAFPIVSLVVAGSA
ncbi:MAG TPA: methyltransferase domain-containing protein [Polyangiaceae bacterium]